MAMAKDLITNLLRSSLLRFIKDASGDQLHLRHLLSGFVELGPGVPLEELAIQQVLLDIGFTATVEVLSAHADVIRVHIPWAKLLSRSTRLVMGTLTVQVRLHSTEELFEVLERGDPASVAEGFLAKQRERLEAMAERRSQKPPEGGIRQSSLLEILITGLRTQVSKLRIEIFRASDEEGSPDKAPTVPPYLMVEFKGFTISPCTAGKRPTMDLSEARAVVQPTPSQPCPPEPLKLWALRRQFRIDSGEAWVLRNPGAAPRTLPAPWDSQVSGEWRRIARLQAAAFRLAAFQACAQKGNESLFVEEGGLLGVERELEFEPPEDASEPSLDLELDDVTALALAPLGGDFLQGFPVSLGWRKRRADELRRHGKESGSFCEKDGQAGPPAPAEPALAPVPAEQPESGPEISIADGEPPKEAMDSFLRDLRRASRPQLHAQKGRGSHDSAIHSFDTLQRDPETQLLLRGWLIKRAKLRPFQDSWQERLCELLQKPNGDGILRYAAAAAGGMQVRGEVELKRGGGARVALFQEAAAEVESNSAGVANLLEYWSRPKADRITEEFAHGFVLQTDQASPHHSRIFFFATNKAADAREWVQAIRSILEIPQTLEAFLGEAVNMAVQAPIAMSSPSLLCVGSDRDPSEVATEDVSDDDDDDDAGSFVSAMDDEDPLPDLPGLEAGRTVSLGRPLQIDEPASIEAMFENTRQWQTFKLTIPSMRVRLSLGTSAAQTLLAGAPSFCEELRLRERVPLHLTVGGLQIGFSTSSHRSGAALAPMALLAGVPDTLVAVLRKCKEHESTSLAAELKVRRVNFARNDVSRVIAATTGSASSLVPIRFAFEQKLEKDSGAEAVVASQSASGSLCGLSACVDVPVLTAAMLFLVELGKGFAPRPLGPARDSPPSPGQGGISALQALTPLGLQLRLEDTEVEVLTPGMPLQGQGLRLNISAMQVSSLEALQSQFGAFCRLAFGK